MSEPDPQPELQIPEVVSELLEPISGDSPAGKDASGEEEYFKLDMEIGKVNPDYRIGIDLASNILTEKSKDLRVATWLCFAWYRSDNISGLKNGLLLLLEMLKQFGDKLFPANPVYRSKAFHYLDSVRFVKLLERETVNKNNTPLFLEIESLLQQLAEEGKKQFPDNIPEFKDFNKVIAAHMETAGDFIKAASPQESPEAAGPADKEVPPREEARSPVPEKKKPVPEAAVSAREITFASDKDAIVAIKKALKYFWQQDKENAIKCEAFLYGISHSLIWHRLTLPPHENYVTQVEAPDPAIQNTFQQWYGNQEWDKLISAIELNFLNEDSGFKFWLTAQRYLTFALEKKGGIGSRAADEVKFQVAGLIHRFPSYLKLKFNNDVPFADKETLKWVDEDVGASFGSGGQEMVLPPILGEEYESINAEYQSACIELPDKFEENIKKMEQGIAAETRRKGRFLRTLNLANLCMQAKQYPLAKVHLSSLLKRIDPYQLTEWEPALCTAAWELAYLVNIKLLEHEENQEIISLLEKEQIDFFAKIGNYDGVLALKLANRNLNKGE